jgi:uncharacterized membrane protein YuzA (DUF378 family)
MKKQIQKYAPWLLAIGGTVWGLTLFGISLPTYIGSTAANAVYGAVGIVGAMSLYKLAKKKK